MQILFFSLLVGFCCGVIGAVYRNVLAYEAVLNWWFRFGDKYEGKWFHWPIWVCAKCFAGQMAGWFWLLFKITPPIIRHMRHAGWSSTFSIHGATTAGALILGLFCSICTAIFTAMLLQSFFNKKA